MTAKYRNNVINKDIHNSEQQEVASGSRAQMQRKRTHSQISSLDGLQRYRAHGAMYALYLIIIIRQLQCKILTL